MKKSNSSGLQFPDSWQVDSTVYTSGQVAVDESGSVIGVGEISTQTRVTFENLRRVLKATGCELNDLVKINTYVVFNGSDEDFAKFWKSMDTVRREFLSEPGPAATAMRVAGLAHPDLLIEIDAIAVKDEVGQKDEGAADER